MYMDIICSYAYTYITIIFDFFVTLYTLSSLSIPCDKCKILPHILCMYASCMFILKKQYIVYRQIKDVTYS